MILQTELQISLSLYIGGYEQLAMLTTIGTASPAVQPTERSSLAYPSIPFSSSLFSSSSTAS